MDVEDSSPASAPAEIQEIGATFARPNLLDFDPAPLESRLEGK